MNKRPIISVVLTTYNQEKYVAQALEGILKQENCPEYEIIVGNDCSTDKTSEIISGYASQYPDRIKILPRPQNLGMLKNMQDCFHNCRGEFIAICEGDDYWTDEHKLLKQYQLLKNNPKALMCFTDISLLMEETQEICAHIPAVKKKLKTTFSIRDLIEKGNPVGNFSCCMYRKKGLDALPQSYFEGNAADYLLNMYMLDKADGIFLKDVCSVYRILPSGQWSGKSQTEQVLELCKCAATYDTLFDSKYAELFCNHLRNVFGINYQKKQKKLFSFGFPVSKKKKIIVEIKKERR